MTFQLKSIHRIALFAGLSGIAATGMAAQSSAYAVSANLTTDGTQVQLAPQLLTSGQTTLGQTYDKPLSTALLSKVVRLVPALARGPALTVLEQKVATDASGANGVDALNTQGKSDAASGTVALTFYPPLPIVLPPTPVPLAASAASAVDDTNTDLLRPLPYYPQPALRIEFAKLQAQANYSQVIPRPSVRTGSTSFGKVTISGSLIGPKPLTFQGDIQPNTVVVNTPTLKITLNSEAIPQNPVCNPGQICPLFRVLETVETKAVDVQLNDAPVYGHHVTGNIVIGDAEAGQ